MSTAEFFEAIRAGNLSAVDSHLRSDPSLASAKNDSGISAVLMSLYSGRPEIRDLLLASAPTLEVHDAAAAGNLACTKQFVEKDPALAKAFSPDGFPVVALATVLVISKSRVISTSAEPTSTRRQPMVQVTTL
jgi:hypothetical protein